MITLKSWNASWNYPASVEIQSSEQALLLHFQSARSQNYVFQLHRRQVKMIN